MGEEWHIESVVVGDGSVGSGVNGKKLYEGIVYASAKASGGHESYHAIDDSSISLLSCKGEDTFVFETELVRDKTQETPLCRVTAEDLDYFVGEAEWDEVLVDSILEWCHRHPGVAVDLGGPKARGVSKALEPWYVHGSKKMVACGGEYSCVKSSIINAVSILKGKRVAERVSAKLAGIHGNVRKLGQVGPIVHQLGERLAIRSLCKQDKALMRQDGFGLRETNVEVA